ncbi:MAG: hypothetical protein ISR65_04230 [Bacteriovoracaceae bacterium]|nr:hypothetical protein [Bacteriovoracaceae bacterium]
MKVISFALILFFGLTQISAARQRSCASRLINVESHDSAVYSLNIDQYNIPDYGNDHLAYGIKSIRILLEKRGCRRQDINFGRTSFGRSSRSRCRAIVPKQESSRVCYVETNIGFFFVTWDMLTGVNITFNRWD